MARLTVAVLLAGCVGPGSTAPGTSGGSTIGPGCAVEESACASEGPGATSAPAGTGGGTVFPGCPVTQAEMEAAVGQSMSAPQVGQPAKNMTQDCLFGFGPFTAGSVQILVFDTEGLGTAMWDSARADAPGATDIPGLADVAFTTASPRANDLFAVKGSVGLHVYVYAHDPLTVDQLAAIARAALARL
jgi:hypothetical protein